MLKTTVFFVCAMFLWASFITESKKRPIAVSFLALMSLDVSLRLSSRDSFDDKPSLYCTPFSKSVSLFAACNTLTPNLPNISITVTEHLSVVTEN